MVSDTCEMISGDLYTDPRTVLLSLYYVAICMMD